MQPVYLDLHIHTSDNPETLNLSYDLDKLIEKIKATCQDSTFLISLTDHNTINKNIYLEAIQKNVNIILGVELHIKNYDKCPPYHCHIFFNIVNITEEVIDDLNSKLNELYPKKIIEKDEGNIPRIIDIINKFDKYDFLLLPHGGQSHSTFDTSIPEDVIFDTTLERSIYYNQFDGFTARGNTGLERTQDYFRRLGIYDFVNLVTSTDNYKPSNYPQAKASDAAPFIPTWMFALPTFDGLRLSLSESSRLQYSKNKPELWSEIIQNAKLEGSNISIDVEFTSGLNVVIGGSSSGKTLLVDSLYRNIVNNFDDSNYSDFNVGDIIVANPSGVTPHYLTQNYIMSVVNTSSDNKIESIDIVKKVFPGDDEVRDKIDAGLRKLRQNFKEMIRFVKIIETETNELNRIPILSRLIYKADIQTNLFDNLLPSDNEIGGIEYTESQYVEHTDTLREIDNILKNNPFVVENSEVIQKLIADLEKVYNISIFESLIRKIIIEARDGYDEYLRISNNEEQTKRQNYEKLLDCIKKYVIAKNRFYEIRDEISLYMIKFDSEEIESMGHKLYIHNHFELNKEILLDRINHFLKSGNKIEKFSDITPESLFSSNFKKQSPKVHNYDDFESKVYNSFQELNKKEYKIKTRDGHNYDVLSAGWKASVILDIILGYDKDIAPVIIDQPEDSLATSYINKGLVEAIKKIKKTKQVILVSHNATIPMLADAQNIVLCRNINNKIIIKSSQLEGRIDGKNVLDYVADITDGGKSSIKKRVKKYNLKKYRDDS